MALSTLDVDYVLNDCRIKLPGAADTGIKQELWGVIKEFLQDSNSWIEHQKLLVTAGENHYTIAPKKGGQIIRLVGVIDGNKIPVNATLEHLNNLHIRQTITISSIDATPTDNSTSASHPWKVVLMKNIELPATKDGIPIAPEFVLKVYSQAIIDGVLGKMMMQQAKSYTNKDLSLYHLKRFRDEIGIARNDIWNQNVFGGQRWSFPPQFATHTQRGYGSTAFPSETA